jgi:hypothetical protein
VQYLGMKPVHATGSGMEACQVAALCGRRPSQRFGGDGEAFLPEVSMRKPSPSPSGGGSK